MRDQAQDHPPPDGLDRLRPMPDPLIFVQRA